MGNQPTSPQSQTKVQVFTDNLSRNKQQIDTRIAEYVATSQAMTDKAFGQHSTEAFASYTSILERGGKRIRGALTIESYRMFGGKNNEVALQAALVMEMVQAYLLVIDDVCDRSQLRRGGPTAHMMLATQHADNNWQDDPDHFGMSIAVLAGMLGMHEAMIEADKIDVDHQTRLAALRNLNYCLSVTAHGQFNDIYNQVAGVTDASAIEDVMVWKTAFYTFVNPLQFGAILAKAPAETLQPLVDFSMQMGKAFQLSDDYIGMFIEEEVSGKCPLDDLREGKHTLQVVTALHRAKGKDKAYLASMLGNQSLNYDELAECRRIITDCGALEVVNKELRSSLDRARGYLADLNGLADNAGIEFLEGMIDYLEFRTS